MGNSVDTVITPGEGPVIVAGFDAAQGDQIDVSALLKFASASQILALATLQGGTDTFIDFGDGTTLTLQGVTPASLIASDFIVTTAPIQVGAGTYTTDPTLILSASPGANFDPLVLFTSDSAATFVNKGSLTLTGPLYATGVETEASANTATFENDGSFSVTAQAAVGVASTALNNSGTFTVTGTLAANTTYGTTGNVDNSGTMTIQGAGQTDGMSSSSIFTNELGATFTVSSVNGVAVGVDMNAAAGTFLNDGTFSVSATAGARGLLYKALGADNISNTGTIAISGVGSGGIVVYGGDATTSVSLDNAATGTITAQEAVGFTGPSAAEITNEGVINGDIELSVGNNTFLNTVTNTGTINGAVYLGNGVSTLDSSLGTIHGVVMLTGGSSSVLLAGEDNTVSIAGGVNVVDGGGGSNTVSYAGTGGVHVSLALQGIAQSTGVSTDTLTNFEVLVGSGGSDTLEGGGSASSTTLTGGLGADTFVYGSGDGDVIVTDFSHAQGDKIDLSSLNAFFSLSEVLAAAAQVGSDTVLTFGGGSLTLRGVAMNSLTPADFGLPTVGPGLGGMPIRGDGISPIFGGLGSDWLQGGPGNDTLVGGAGSDYLDGGGGFNTALYVGVLRQYTVGPGGIAVAGGPEGGTDVLSNIQRIQFTDGYLAYSPTDTAGEVYRLYEATLNRAPDQEGLTNWVNQLNSGVSLQTVANGFVGSQEFQNDYGPSLSNTDFVILLYENVLHREPDASGLANWVGYLTSGQDSRAQVVLGFSESQEYIGDFAPAVEQGLWVGNPDAAEVARLYDAVLGRLPDSQGLANWTNALENGTSLQTVANGFVGSQEFQTVYGTLNDTDFVTLLYSNVLHRAPDASGLNNWVTDLGNGSMTRAQVVLGFSESPEHIANMAPHIDSGIWVAG